MALWDIQLFGTKKEAVDYVDDALFGTVNLHGGAAVDGLTVIIDAGSGPQTVTFAPAKNRAWTLTEITTFINAAHASLADISRIDILQSYQSSVYTPHRRLKILKDSAITVDKDGTANALLGLPTVADWVRDQILDTEVFQFEFNHDEKDTWAVITFR